MNRGAFSDLFWVIKNGQFHSDLLLAWGLIFMRDFAV